MKILRLLVSVVIASSLFSIAFTIQNRDFCSCCRAPRPIPFNLNEVPLPPMAPTDEAAPSCCLPRGEAKPMDLIQGVEVFVVDPGTPAERIGMRSKDVILSIGDRRTYELDDVIRAVRRHPGGKMKIEFWNRCATVTASATVSRGANLGVGVFGYGSVAIFLPPGKSEAQAPACCQPMPRIVDLPKTPEPPLGDCECVFGCECCGCGGGDSAKAKQKASLENRIEKLEAFRVHQGNLINSLAEKAGIRVPGIFPDLPSGKK